MHLRHLYMDDLWEEATRTRGATSLLIGWDGGGEASGERSSVDLLGPESVCVSSSNNFANPNEFLSAFDGPPRHL